MDPNAYVITFPMLMAGFIAVGGTALGLLVKKWVADSERADTERKASLDKSLNEIKEQIRLSAQAEHESFSKVHARIDELQAKREDDQKTIGDLRVELAKAVTREELGELREHIEARFQAILSALAGRTPK